MSPTHSNNFNHSEILKTKILDLYKRGKITVSGDRYLINSKELSIYFRSNHLNDVEKFDSDLNLKDISLNKWFGRWNSNTINSYSKIDECALLSIIELMFS